MFYENYVGYSSIMLFTISLSKFEKGTSITETAIIDLLKEINPVAQHQERTWKAYADRMGQWLFATGYIVRSRDDWSINDQGDINLEFTKTSGGHSISDSILLVILLQRRQLKVLIG